MEIALAHDDPECRVEQQKRFDESGLIPKEKCVEQGMVLWECWHRKRYVMYVDDDTPPETRQDLEVKKVDVTILLADVAGIDEEDIVRGQLFEYTKFDILYLAGSKLDASAGNQLAQFISWVRLYARQPRRHVVLLVAPPQCAQRVKGRDPRANLDNE